MKADLANGAVVGNYRVLQKLGEYPEYVSYSARTLETEQEVLLKAMRQPPALVRLALPDFQGRTTQFIQLQHPRLCLVREILRDEQAFYIVSELNRGQRLKEALQQCGRFSYTAALAIVDQVLELLTYLHAQRIICCDLRPTNFYLDDAGMIQLADAGLIQLLSLENQTTTPETISALEYTAPERILYSKILGTKVDARADLYAVGVLFYELLSGRPPLTAENRDQMIRVQIEAVPLPLLPLSREVPPHVEQLIFRALEKSPERRFAAAETMRMALQRAQLPSAPLTPLEPSLAYMMEALRWTDGPAGQAATGALPITDKLSVPTEGQAGELKPETFTLSSPDTTGSLPITANLVEALANAPTLEPRRMDLPITEPLPTWPAEEKATLPDIFPGKEEKEAPTIASEIAAEVVTAEPSDDLAFEELRAHVQPFRWRKAVLVACVLGVVLVLGSAAFWMSRSKTSESGPQISALAVTKEQPNAPAPVGSPDFSPTPTATLAPRAALEVPTPPTESNAKVVATTKNVAGNATPEPRLEKPVVAPTPALLASQSDKPVQSKAAFRPPAISEKECRKRAILQSLSQ